jgi:hypothetical protein
MIAVTVILLAAGFTGLVCLLAGKLALRFLNANLYDEEEHFFGFVLGASIVSLLIFLLGVARAAHYAAFLALGAGVILLAARRGVWRRSSRRLPPLPDFWRWLFVAVYALFAYIYLSNALTPETSADAATYHLGFPVRYLAGHRIVPVTTDMYANLGQGIEMLFMFALALGRHSAAAVVHFMFLLTLPLGMLCYGKRIGKPLAGVVGGLLFFLAPVVGRAGTVAYVDVATACVCFAVFYSLQIWRESRETPMLVVTGILAGFAFAVKYTAGAMVPYAVIVVLATGLRRRQAWLKPVLILGCCAALMVAPWLIKNTLVTGNPVAPFFNKYFLNPHFHISTEQEYLRNMRNFNGVTIEEYPMAVVLKGDRVAGLLGPVFLLTPLALLALRFPAGRQLVPLAIVLLLPALNNLGTRFLIPPLPLVCMSLALVFTQWQLLGALLICAHAVFSHPSVVPRYAAQYAWRLEGTDWKAALRIIPEEETLSSRMSDYAIGRMLDRYVPRGELILCLPGCQRSYNRSNIINSFGSGLSDTLVDDLWSSSMDHKVPIRRHEFWFPEFSARGIRLVQTAKAASSDQTWAINEVRVFSDSAGPLPSDGWNLLASQNPWDVRRAFDSNPITRWDSFETRAPGFRVEARFPKATLLSRVVVECSHDQGDSRMRLEYLSAAGRWFPVPERARIYEVPPSPDLPRYAAEALKGDGVRWIVYEKSWWMHDDFVKNLQSWNAEVIATRGDYTLYKLR